MIFAIDGGGTTFKTCLVDESGVLSEVESIRVQPDLGVAGLRDPLMQVFDRLRKKASSEGRPVRAVGIGCRGVIDRTAKRMVEDTGALAFFSGRPFSDLIETDLPLGVANDAQAATLGEIRFGAGADLKNFLLLTLGTGIGGGIVIDGRVYTGHSGMAGELGHFPVNPNGDPCGCGNVGCLEREFSTRAFKKRIGEINPRRRESERIGGVKDLFVWAEHKGDPQAMEIIRRGVFYLARAISGYANAVDPAKVILSGGISKAGDFLLNMLVEELKPILWRKDPEQFVMLSRLGAQMGLYGAGAVGFAELER